MDQSDVAFEADDGVVLRGVLFRPDAAAACPTVAMAHGAGGHKEWQLPGLAARLAAVGIASLAFDNRSFGASGGEPRCEIDPLLQARDYRAAISYLLCRDDVSRVGVYGTSLSGGVVLVVGAADRRLSCVVAQVPFFDGPGAYARRFTPAVAAGMRRDFDADRLARFRGGPPAYVPHAVEDPDDPAAGRSANRIAFFRQLTAHERVVWENRLTLRSLEYMGEFVAVSAIPLISPTPLLLVMVESEMSWAGRAYDVARDPKKIVVVPGEHYDVYSSGRERAEREVVDWFATWLLDDRPAR